MIQETLEEAAEKFRNENPGTMQGGNNTKIIKAFIEGAKWQQEQDKKLYSEEEVFELLENLVETFNPPTDHLREWFEQFKKK